MSEGARDGCARRGLSGLGLNLVDSRSATAQNFGLSRALDMAVNGQPRNMTWAWT